MFRLSSLAGLACLVFPGVLLAQPTYLKLEQSIPVKRPADAAVVGDRLFVLSRLGDIQVFDRQTLKPVGLVQVKDAIAIAAQQPAGPLFAMGLTSTRGPWQTLFSIEPSALSVELQFKLTDQVGFNEHGIGFAVTDSGDLVVNPRHNQNNGGVLTLEQVTGRSLRRAKLPSTRVQDGHIDHRVLAHLNASRLRLLGSNLYALNMVTGSVYVLDAESLALTATLSPGPSPFSPPKLNEKGGVVVAWAAFDLVPEADGSVFLLQNGFHREGAAILGSVLRAGSSARPVKLSSSTPRETVSFNYDASIRIDAERLLLLSSAQGRADVFVAAER